MDSGKSTGKTSYRFERSNGISINLSFNNRWEAKVQAESLAYASQLPITLHYNSNETEVIYPPKKENHV